MSLLLALVLCLSLTPVSVLASEEVEEDATVEETEERAIIVGDDSTEAEEESSVKIQAEIAEDASPIETEVKTDNSDGDEISPITVEDTPLLDGGTTLPSNLYVIQQTGVTCTLASCVMMLRAKLYLGGYASWSSVTESSVRPVAWDPWGSLGYSWTYSIGGNSMTVAHKEVSGLSISSLKALLNAHPEGVVIYCRSIPHAILVTDYEGDTFYGADPVSGYSGRRKISETWLAKLIGDQSKILSSTNDYWYISSSNITITPTTYTFRLTGMLDGDSFDTLVGAGTCDVYINGKLAANDVEEYSASLPTGTTYEIRDIRTSSDWYSYAGVSSGSLSGTVGTSAVDVQLHFIQKHAVVMSGGNTPPVSEGFDIALIYIKGDLTRIVMYGDTVGELQDPVMIGSDYVFSGWYTEPSGGTRVTEDTVVYKDMVVYAQWVPPGQYTVNFDANGGSCSDTVRTVNAGKIIGDLPTPVRSGYTFDGWYTDPFGGTRVTSSTVVTSSVTLYAHWTNLTNYYTICFNASDGVVGGVRGSFENSLIREPYVLDEYDPDCVKLQFVTAGTYLWDYGIYPAPSAEGYEFVGWRCADESWNDMVLTMDTLLTEGILENMKYTAGVYAIYERKSFTITYNANGGTGAPLKQTWSEALTIPLQEPSRVGYTFCGWGFYADDTEGVLMPGETYLLTPVDRTLYAVWKMDETPHVHDWAAWTVSKQATCTGDGEETRICSSDASHIETRIVPALGHDLIYVEGREPTCWETGNIEYWYCERCDKYYADAYAAHEISEYETLIDVLPIPSPVPDAPYNDAGALEAVRILRGLVGIEEATGLTAADAAAILQFIGK